MTDAEFKANMDLLAQSLGMANRLAMPLSNEDLRMLKETICRADDMGMFPRASDRLSGSYGAVEGAARGDPGSTERSACGMDNCPSPDRSPKKRRRAMAELSTEVHRMSEGLGRLKALNAELLKVLRVINGLYGTSRYGRYCPDCKAMSAHAQTALRHPMDLDQ